MIPTFFLELQDTTSSLGVMQKYFDNQYPDTEDCNILNKQIVDIQKDIDSIITRMASSYNECNCSITIKTPCTQTGSISSIGCINGFKTGVNPEYSKAILIRNESKKYLEGKLTQKKNMLSMLNCGPTSSNLDILNQTNPSTNNTTNSNTLNTPTTNPISNITELMSVNSTQKSKKYLIFGVIAVVLLTGGTIYYIKTKKQ